MAYAKEDEAYKNKLSRHLTLLKRRKQIAEFAMGEVGLGKAKDKAIKEQLNIAHIILLLISDNFLHSESCYEIEQVAMERHAENSVVVVPIYIKYADTFGAHFTELQSLPRNGVPIANWLDADEAYTHISKELRVLVDSFKNQDKEEDEWN